MVTAAPAFGLSGSIFPFLFVTIACGAASGFHGLVCSGTTSKQIAKESDTRLVGYGGMLLEAFVALIALATIMIVAPDAAKGVAPGRIYGDGIARFLTVAIGEGAFLFAATFGAMAFSTFVFDTLDVATRLGRYILQELAGVSGRGAALVATALTCLVPLVFLRHAGPGSYMAFWTLFGTSNELLAGLSLLGITVWVRRSGRRWWLTAAPAAFVLAVTVTSLVLQARTAFADGAPGGMTLANGLVAVGLLGLAAALGAAAMKRLREPVPAGAP